MLTDARVLQTTGELDKALGAVEWALAMDPTNADAALLRDELLEALALRNLPRDEAGSALELLRSLPPANGGVK